MDIIEELTEKEFKDIKKQKGISNAILENMIRDIETVLNYIDSKGRYVSNTIRKKIVDKLIRSFTKNKPKKDFYIEKLSEIDFSRKKVIDDLTDKEIDEEYRLKELSDILPEIDRTVERLLKQEKDFLLNDNNQKLYNQMLKESQNGKKFTKEDLTYDVMFELSIIENIIDISLAELFNMKKTQIRYLRKKMGLTKFINKKMEVYPEAVMYYIEEKNERLPGVSNYEYEQMINACAKELFKTKEEQKEEVTIDVDGKKEQYHITFSDEKYVPNTKKGKRISKGSHHNHKKETETKIDHGKIGEKLAFEAEKLRLNKIGLESLIKDVELVAQVDEETTFDGLGYDLLSFNENREKICIEVKTSFGTKDKPFFISKKEIELIKGLKEEYDCKYYLIYYVLVDGSDVTIKRIYSSDFDNLRLTPVLYKVESI